MVWIQYLILLNFSIEINIHINSGVRMRGEKGSINKWERLVNQERVGQVRDSQSAKGPGLSFELKW